MAEYEVIDLREELARTADQPLTEAELWADMVRGDISPVEYEIKAARLERWPGYVRFERRRYKWTKS